METTTLKKVKEFQVLSPDGFTIEREPATYKSPQAALDAFTKWARTYPKISAMIKPPI